MNEKSKVKVKDKRSVQSRENLSASEKVIKEAQRTTESASGGASTEASQRDTLQTKLRAQEIVNELNQLYSPDNFSSIVKGPADLMLLNTNRELWRLTDKEVNLLATNASVTAKYWLLVDPKWLSLAMLAMSTLTIYGTRYMLQIKEERKEAHEVPAKKT